MYSISFALLLFACAFHLRVLPFTLHSRYVSVCVYPRSFIIIAAYSMCVSTYLHLFVLLLLLPAVFPSSDISSPLISLHYVSSFLPYHCVPFLLFFSHCLIFLLCAFPFLCFSIVLDVISFVSQFFFFVHLGFLPLYFIIFIYPYL